MTQVHPYIGAQIIYLSKTVKLTCMHKYEHLEILKCRSKNINSLQPKEAAGVTLCGGSSLYRKRLVIVQKSD